MDVVAHLIQSRIKIFDNLYTPDWTSDCVRNLFAGTRLDAIVLWDSTISFPCIVILSLLEVRQ